MATALGCLPSAIDKEPVCNVLELLDYWREEPPTHVILAMRYLGDSKKSKKRITEQEARNDMRELSGVLGQAARPMPAHLKQLVQQAEQVKKEHKGFYGGKS